MYSAKINKRIKGAELPTARTGDGLDISKKTQIGSNITQRWTQKELDRETDRGRHEVQKVWKSSESASREFPGSD